MIDCLGEMPVRKIFSKSWQLRDQGLSDIAEMIDRRVISGNSGFLNSVGACKVTSNDKNATVLIKSYGLLAKTCESFANVSLDSTARQTFSGYSDSVLSSLVEKLGDNLQKVRVGSEEALLSSCNHREFGVRSVLTYLVSDKAPVPAKGGKAQAKKPLSNKLLVAKY